MNERIQELVRQATTKEAYYPAGNDGHPEYRIDFNKEKFAELIVRECAAIIANDTANYQEEGMMAYYQGVQDSVKSIRKHFGVDLT